MNRMTHRITRREFLIGSALLTASAILADGLWLMPDGRWQPAEGQPAGHQPVVVARGKDYGRKLKQAITRLGGVSVVARRGERVLIKPTLAWNRMPGQGANVHPEVLHAAIELALRGGAQQVVLFDRTSLRSQFAYAVSGADRVVRQLNDPRVVLVHLTEEDFVPFETKDRCARPLRETNDEPSSSLVPRPASLVAVKVCRYLLEADRVINLATARHHPTRRVSLGMANLLGLIGGGRADAEWLRHQAAELALLSAAIRPELTILDATRAIVRNGPMGHGAPDVARWDTLVVSRDSVAVEAYGARLFGLDSASLPHLALAEQLGLGAAALDRGRLIELS